ncbi:MAG: GNA1162 family protein [bacterium]
MTSRPLFYFFLALVFLPSCATVPIHKDYTKFRIEDPKSILVVPVVNRSVDVDAPDYFLSTATLPIAERGYYVFPVNLVKRLLEDDGLADADLVHSADPTRVAELFGVDAILYISIQRWDAKFMILTTTVTVQFDYSLKSGKTGETLWEHQETMVYNPQQQNSSGNPLADLIVMAVSAAITKAAPNYVPLAKQANGNAVGRLHQGLPAGPHHKKYNQDMADF